MIDKALDTLVRCLQGYLIRLPELNITSETVVKLSQVVKHDGTVAIESNTLGLCLVNIEEERVTKAQIAYSTTPDGRTRYEQPELKLNLYFLIAANFVDYKTGLEFLSGAVRFFQSNNVFTPHDLPSLDPRITKLIVELWSLDFEQLNHLWGYLGGKYLPSVLYRVRMLRIKEELTEEERPPIRIIQASTREV